MTKQKYIIILNNLFTVEKLSFSKKEIAYRIAGIIAIILIMFPTQWILQSLGLYHTDGFFNTPRITGMIAGFFIFYIVKSFFIKKAEIASKNKETVSQAIRKDAKSFKNIYDELNLYNVYDDMGYTNAGFESVQDSFEFSLGIAIRNYEKNIDTTSGFCVRIYDKLADGSFKDSKKFMNFDMKLVNTAICELVIYTTNEENNYDEE